MNLPPCIHFAGTNGKGSVLTFLKSCLFHNNLTVNALISPHLLRINERIVIKNNFPVEIHRAHNDIDLMNREPILIEMSNLEKYPKYE